MRTVDSQDLEDRIDGFDADKATNIEKLELAQAAIFFAIDLLSEVVDATRNEYARAYMVDHLKIMASANHGFVSRDFNLDRWINQVKGRDDDD